MHLVRRARWAVLFHLQPIFDRLFVLLRSVVDFVALGAFEFDEVVLRHRNGRDRKNRGYVLRSLGKISVPVKGGLGKKNRE